MEIIKEKHNRLDFIKTASAFHKKLLEIFFKVTEGKVFANHISNREFIAQNIYKLSKIKIKKTKLIYIFKMGKRLEQTLHQISR